MIYHYCNADVFESIIKNREIWLSDVTKLNDESEYKLGYKIIREVLNEFGLAEHDIVNEMSDANLNEGFQILICSFSYNGDLKSQWDKYAAQATGMSIGFDYKALEQIALFNKYLETGCQPVTNGVKFLKVNYDESLLRNRARAYIKEYIDSESPIKWQLLARNLMFLSIRYKGDFFKEENEARLVLVIEKKLDNNYYIELRKTDYGDANYHRLKISMKSSHSIVEVIIGPKSPLTIESVNSILLKEGIHNVSVKQSKATGQYR